MSTTREAVDIAEEIANVIYRQNPQVAGLDIVATILPVLEAALAAEPLPTAGWQEEQKLLTLGEARTYLEIAKMADKRAQTYDEVCVPLLDFAFTLRQMAVPLPFPPFPSDPPAEKDQ